jgi:hypothetical protein
LLVQPSSFVQTSLLLLYDSSATEQRQNGEQEPDGDVVMAARENDALEAELLVDAESGRDERIRLLSLDGISDPRNDRTIHDVDYATILDLSGLAPTFLPDGDVSSAHAVIERELSVQQQIIRELDGSQSFPPGLPEPY